MAGGVLGGCAAMLVTITTSGGFGGFGLARSAAVEIDTLPDPLRAEACARLAPDVLGDLAGSTPRGADRIVYHIVVAGEGAQASRFDLSETTLPDATLDVIDALLDLGARR
jgi:hypothetical protein